MNIDLKKIFDLAESEDTVDSKSAVALLKAIKANAGESFDYLKFKNAIEELRKLDLDEEVAIKSALTTAGAMGIETKDMINSAKSYRVVLKKELEKFSDALNGQIAQKVKKRRDEVKAMEQKRIDYQRKIEKMQSELETFDERAEQLKNEADKAESKLDMTKNKFLSAYRFLDNTISSDIAAMEKTNL